MLQAVLPIGHGDLNLRQPGDHIRFLAAVSPLPGDVEAQGTVDGPCIHIKKAQAVRQSPGQGALPRPGGAVDGNAVMGHSPSSSM